MLDALDREINYLRISITARCNLRCRYCMPGDIPSVPHEAVLRYEEILRICRIAASVGITRLRITGGEPLVRKGAPELLAALRQVPEVETIALTTNGVLLAQYLDRLRPARLDWVNISLDTLSRSRYRDLTGVDGLPQAMEGILGALAAGLAVKLNCVLMRGINEDEILPLAELVLKLPLDVRFIELMPVGAARGLTRVPGTEVLRVLKSAYPDLIPAAARGNGPARYYHSPAFLGRVGFIDAIGEHFCGECNRVRLSSQGFLRLCLYHGEGLDLRGLLRSGADDGELRRAMEQAIGGKPEGHCLEAGDTGGLQGLSGIGGERDATGRDPGDLHQRGPGDREARGSPGTAARELGHRRGCPRGRLA